MFIPFIMAARPPAILFLFTTSLDLLSFFFFCRLIFVVTLPIVIFKTSPHVRRWPRFIKFCLKFGWPLPRNLASQKHQNFGAISHNFATWSWISPESNKTSSIKIRPEFWHPTGGHQAGHCHASSLFEWCASCIHFMAYCVSWWTSFRTLFAKKSPQFLYARVWTKRIAYVNPPQ